MGIFQNLLASLRSTSEAGAMARDSRTLFHRLSQKMRADFDVSAHIHHAGSKGTARENTLKEFLAEGRLPMKYGVGAGEIIGHVRDVSPQCDLIIFDRINGATLLSDPDVQIYPIENVYGIIEVKSALSKAELLDGLEKIKAVKLMKPFGSVAKSIGGGMQFVHARPQPFGMIFAYGLADNSLDSLLDNLREWEVNNPREVWPNYICVLETGVILHNGEPFEELVSSDKFNDKTWPSNFPWKEDSLFKFYIALLDVCSGMDLGPVELDRYFNPATKVGKYHVEGHVEFTRRRKDTDEPGAKVRLSERALDRIVAYGEANGSMKYGDYLRKRFGQLPMGMEGTKQLKNDIHIFFPGEAEAAAEAQGRIKENMTQMEMMELFGLLHLHEIAINGKLYAISFRDMTEEDYEEVK
jgi:hypothetical protein